MATSIPLLLAGATSATYIGDRTDAAPTARPPNKRAQIKRTDVADMAVRAHDTAKNRATTMRTLLRPKRSVRIPEPNAPKIAPTRRELTPHPNSNSFHPK